MRLRPLQGSSPPPHLSHLQRNLEAELLGVVAEDTPRGAEEDEGDPGLGPHDLLLQTQQVEMMSFPAAYPPPNWPALSAGHLLLQQPRLAQLLQELLPPLPVGGVKTYTLLVGTQRLLPHQHEI